jgi:hypothetical protein
MDENKYWLVRADEPYLSLSLEKLGVPEKKIKTWIGFINVRTSNIKDKFIYVHSDIDGVSWFDHNKNSQSWYMRNNYKYKGLVKIEDFEADANKYNL